MERLYITHYYYPGTDPWKNIMLLPEDEAFQVAGELAAVHPETTSFGRFADFRNYYPARKRADEYVRAKFIALGGKPILAHPYSFTLMECEYLRKWFSNGEKLVQKRFLWDTLCLICGNGTFAHFMSCLPTGFSGRLVSERRN